jgi:hypothetical protein
MCPACFCGDNGLLASGRSACGAFAARKRRNERVDDHDKLAVRCCPLIASMRALADGVV